MLHLGILYFKNVIFLFFFIIEIKISLYFTLFHNIGQSHAIILTNLNIYQKNIGQLTNLAKVLYMLITTHGYWTFFLSFSPYNQ